MSIENHRIQLAIPAVEFEFGPRGFQRRLRQRMAMFINDRDRPLVDDGPQVPNRLTVSRILEEVDQPMWIRLDINPVLQRVGTQKSCLDLV